MKKILPYLTIPIILGLLILIITDNREKKISKIITVNTNYHYLYQQNETIDISFYTNELDIPLNDINVYDNFYLKNNLETQILYLELKEVTYSHNEIYLEEEYANYILKFKMPNLENDFYINDAYLVFSFKNEQTYILKIGAFKLFYQDNLKLLSWNLIDSKKNQSENHSISQIIIGLDNNISSESLLINIGFENNNSYELLNSLLTIFVPETEYFTNNFFILIETNYETFYLGNKSFTKEYNLLTKARGIINIYEFNWT